MPLLIAFTLFGIILMGAILFVLREEKESERLDLLVRESADSLVQEPKRLIQTLRALKASGPAQEELDALVSRLEPQFPGCTIEVNLLGTEEQVNIYSRGILPIALSVCKFTALLGDTLAIDDATQVKFLDGNPLLAHANSYLGHPLYVEGIKVGACCVHDPNPHRWTPLDQKRIHSLSTRVSVLLEKHLVTV